MLQRYLFFIVFTFLGNVSLQAVIIYPNHEKIWLGNCKPSIFWDVDGVLLNRTGPEPINIAKFSVHLTLIDPTQKMALLKSIPNILEIQPEEKNNPKKIFAACKRFGTTMRAEIEEKDLDPVIDEFVAKHSILQQKTKSNIPFGEQIKSYASRGVPKEGTIKIMQKLHEEGYPIGIATNQGYKTFKRILDAKTVPDETHYALMYTCDYNNPNPTIASHFIKKPNKEYFIDLKKKAEEKKLNTQLLVFIDDRIENVEAAAQEGIIGIHYENDVQLMQDFETLGILKNSVVCPTPAVQ